MKIGMKASFARLAAGILVLAALVVLIIFIAKVRFFSGSLVEDSKCKNSILNHVAAQKASGGDVETTITCKTNYYTVKARSEEEAKFALAEALKACWGTWGKGEVQLFSKDAVYCHVCSVTSFNTGGRQMSVNQFPQYLASARISSGPGAGLTYGKYLSYYATEDSDEETLEKLNSLESTSTLDLSKDYAAVFVYARGSNYITDFLRNIDPTGVGSGSVTSGIIGGVIGGGLAYAATKVVAGVFIVGGPVAWVVGGVVIGAGLAISTFVTDDVDYLSMTMLREYNAQELTRIGCSIAPVAQDNERRRLG